MRWFILQDNLDKCHLSDFHALAKIKTQSTGDSDADDDNVANAATFLKYARNLFATWFRDGLTGLAWPAAAVTPESFAWLLFFCPPVCGIFHGCIGCWGGVVRCDVMGLVTGASSFCSILFGVAHA